MKKIIELPLSRYGLVVRYVVKKDAEFILSLRTNPFLARHLNETSTNLDRQISWIESYKERESKGLEHYFIFEKKGVKVGLIRIYNISEKNATSGSWLCLPNISYEIPIIILVIMREFFFETLNLTTEIMDTRRNNKQVIKTHHLFGAVVTGKDDIDVFHELSRNIFLMKKNRILKLVGIK
jgi:hypothetical protein